MSQQPSPLRPGAFMETLIGFLMPFFIRNSPDAHTARADILETLCSYGGRTRAEVLSAARALAFSLAALDTIAASEAADLSPAMTVRYRGCANGLNRSAAQNEKNLDRSLSRDAPVPTDLVQEPLNDVPEAEVADALVEARAVIATHSTPAITTRTTDAHPAVQPAATGSTQQERNRRIWADVLLETLQEMGVPPAPATNPVHGG